MKKRITISGLLTVLFIALIWGSVIILGALVLQGFVTFLQNVVR